MVGRAKREEIRRFYKAARLAAGDKTQLEVESLAKLRVGRYWKIENGVVEPDEHERADIARVLRLKPDDLPSVNGRAA